MSASKVLRRNRGWVAAAVLVVVAGVTYYAYTRAQPEDSTISYQTEASAVGTISVTVSGTGNVEIDGTTEVYPAVSGTVASIGVTEGANVVTGTVLFTLEPDDAQAATAKALASLRQAQHSVAQAESQVAKAESNLATLEKRSTEPSSTVTSADIAAAQAEVALAEASLASAQASSASALISYNQTKAAEDDLAVVSPCSGVIHSLGVSAGDAVSAGNSTSSSTSSGTTGGGVTTASSSAASSSDAPVVIAPEQPLVVHLTVNEVDLASLAIGQRADIEFDALPTVAATGKVYEIASEGSVNSGVVTFDVWLSIDVASPSLRQGMSAAATIVTQVARDVLLVPNSAVKTADDGTYYVLVLTDGAAEPHQVSVETGLSSSTQTEVTSGLEEGALVVTQTIDSSDTDAGTGIVPGSGIMQNMGGGFRG